jgi:1,2-diacylglycerol 3-alpha-glucosyltransferase
LNILFVYTGLPQGGIETFFVRMASKLYKKDHSLRFLFFTNNFDEELLNELKQYAKICFINDYLYIPSFLKDKSPIFKLLFPLKYKKLFKEILFDINHVHAPDYNSLLYSSKICSVKDEFTMSTGVYHTNEYNFKKFKNWYFGNFIIKLLQKISAKNILFFNEISNQYYNTIYDNKFKDSLITPIGVDVSSFKDDFVGKQNNRIVSIGRLSSWKKYNFHMIEAVHALQQQGITIHYDSYGDGDQLEVLNALVTKYNLNHLVKFHSGVPYSQFKNTIANSLLFIGSGTALIEASACGIPALIGIENESEPVSYGFLHNVTSYSYHEQQLPYERKEIVEFILYLLKGDQTRYKSECEKAKLRANDFSIDKTVFDFEKMCFNAEKIQVITSYFELLKIVFSMFLNKIVSPKANYSNRL